VEKVKLYKFNPSYQGILTVKHEWGHNVKDTVLGTPKYITRIALPSVTACQFISYDKTYFSLPWERSADFFGGAYMGDSTIGSDALSGFYTIMS